MEHVPKPRSWRSLVPTGLALGMLAVVLAAALAPNAGVVAAQSTCQYSNCSTTTSTPFPWLDVGIIGAVIAALLVAAALLVRRRGSGGDGSQGPPEPWQPSSPAEPTEAAPPASESESAPPPAEAPPAEAYDENTPPPPDSGTGGTSDEDINSLMNELEKMSGK